MAPPKLKPVRGRTGVDQLIQTRTSPRFCPAAPSETVASVSTSGLTASSSKTMKIVTPSTKPATSDRSEPKEVQAPIRPVEDHTDRDSSLKREAPTETKVLPYKTKQNCLSCTYCLSCTSHDMSLTIAPIRNIGVTLLDSENTNIFAS